MKQVRNQKPQEATGQADTYDLLLRPTFAFRLLQEQHFRAWAGPPQTSLLSLSGAAKDGQEHLVCPSRTVGTTSAGLSHRGAPLEAFECPDINLWDLLHSLLSFCLFCCHY